MKKRILILLLVLIMPVLLSAQVSKPMVASDLMKIATTSEIQISPGCFFPVPRIPGLNTSL